jgi:hypothetical protein
LSVPTKSIAVGAFAFQIPAADSSAWCTYRVRWLLMQYSGQTNSNFHEVCDEEDFNPKATSERSDGDPFVFLWLWPQTREWC